MPRPFRLAVVGAGPSAFYAASRVLSRLPNARVHLFDRLWAPHGLVRYGVAPDHPEVKNCVHKFDETALDSRFRFFGNVAFATQQSQESQSLPHALSLPIKSLLPHYTHLLLAYGASQPISLRYLDPTFTRSALSFVHWYTGHPLHATSPPPPLSTTKHLTLVGHGNVSLDIARLLLTDPSSLSSLDIPRNVIEHLKTSSIDHINIVSRRGPAQVAFTAKELREMMSLPNAALRPIPASLFDDLKTAEGGSAPALTRQQSRIIDLMRKGSKSPYGSTAKTWSLEFFRTPISSEVNTTTDGKEAKSITFDLNALDEQGRARPTGETETQQTDLVVTSLGYHSNAFASSVSPGPLDHSSPQEVVAEDSWHDPILGRVRTSTDGKVMDSEGRHVAGVYASGWAANGARGVLASSMYDAYAVADTMAEEYLAAEATAGATPAQPASNTPPFESTVFPMATEPPADDAIVPAWLAEEAAKAGGKRIVTYDDWKRIDNEEIRRGKEYNKDKERMSWSEVDQFLSTSAT